MILNYKKTKEILFYLMILKYKKNAILPCDFEKVYFRDWIFAVN